MRRGAARRRCPATSTSAPATKASARSCSLISSGTWPGIYTFDAGRLKVVDRAPVPETPAKPAGQDEKAKKPAKPKTATREIERAYVQ